MKRKPTDFVLRTLMAANAAVCFAMVVTAEYGVIRLCFLLNGLAALATLMLTFAIERDSDDE